jgi:TetR/AcrR family transcriptional repressor of nem operon
MPKLKTTKAEVVRQATEVFRAKGFHATSMDDLATACGLRKGSFYHYFPSKEALLTETLEQALAYFRAKVFALAYQPDSPPRQRLQTMLDKYAKLLFYNPNGCYLGNLTLELAATLPSIKPLLWQFFADWAAALSHLYQAKYQPAFADQLAWQMVMEMEGALMLGKLSGQPTWAEQCAARMLAHLDI